MSNRGIDYGMGQTNVDKENGIRYGVISQNEVLQAWADSSEGYYGKPTCRECGNEAMTIEKFSERNPDVETDNEDKWKQEPHECADYICPHCYRIFGSESAFSDEALSFYIDDGEYLAECGEDGDIFITKSPYYTRAQFCSPCAPGACYLTNPTEDGEKAYCFGHDWFEDGKAPYPVYRMSDDTLVEPESK